MDSYNQKKRDPSGFYGSMAFVAALVAVGAFADFARSFNPPVAVIFLVAVFVSIWLWRRAKAAT